MTLETNATLSAFSKLVGFLLGTACGFALGGWLASLVGRVAPGIHPLLWFAVGIVLFVAGTLAGLLAVAFAVDFVWSHVTAECPDASCDGRVHALRTNVYRCDRCGATHGSKSTGGSEFLPIVRRTEERLQRALHVGRRGNLSVSEAGSQGALSDPERERRAKEKA